MKVYVASKFQNYEAVREAVSAVEGRGHTITFDWTRGEGFDPVTGAVLSYNDESPLEVQVNSAAMDISGVRRCDVMLVLAHPGMCGGMVEFGVALALCKRVAVVEPDKCFTIFYRLDGVSLHGTVNEALEALEL